MVIKINNKDENFYNYMGKFFGSRLVEKQVNDRIYDDQNKDWYIYLEEDKALAFVSVSNDVLKNVYTLKDEYLIEILKKIKEDMKIKTSVVPKIYKIIYEKAGLIIYESYDYKNFIAISG